MIQSAALRAADFKQEHQREAQAMTGLRMIMETLDAQVGTKKQIEAERFRKFWRCRHKPAGVHNKAWGLFVSQISSLFQAIKDTLSIDTFLDQLITVIDTTYHSGVYQGLVDIVQATMLRYAITESNLQLVLSEIIRVGKAYERVRTLPARTTRTNNITTSRVKNITPFPGHRDNPIALTTIPLEKTACDDQHPWLRSPHQGEEEPSPEVTHPETLPLISVCWRCCATPDDVKQGLVIAHNSSEKMLEHCPLSTDFKKAFPKKHAQFMERHNLTLADEEFAQRHQNRITQFKQDMTDRRGRMRLDPPRPARNTVQRPVPLYRHKSIIPNGTTPPHQQYQQSSRVFTSAVSWADPVDTNAHKGVTEAEPSCLEVDPHDPTALTFFPDVTAHDFEVTLQHVPALLAVSRSTSDVSTLECPLGPASTGLPDAIWTKCGLPKAYCNLIAIPDSGAVASCMSEALFNALTKIGGVRTDVRPPAFLKACGHFKTLNSTRCKIIHYVVVAVELGSHWVYIQSAVVRGSTCSLIIGLG